MLHGPDEPVYTISVAARLLGVTPQVLRQIEHEGLIEPRRTESNIRLYSENDLRRLQRIIHLLRDKGINAAGVRFILAAEEEARSRRETGPPESGEEPPKDSRGILTGRTDSPVVPKKS